MKNRDFFIAKFSRIKKDCCLLKQQSFLVDLKGIEPSNLTDANRALSQLSYKPLSKPDYYNTFFENVK